MCWFSQWVCAPLRIRGAWMGVRVQLAIVFIGIWGSWAACTAELPRRHFEFNIGLGNITDLSYLRVKMLFMRVPLIAIPSSLFQTFFHCQECQGDRAVTVSVMDKIALFSGVVTGRGLSTSFSLQTVTALFRQPFQFHSPFAQVRQFLFAQ